MNLINCEMIDTDLCFEKSDVEAAITTNDVTQQELKEILGGGDVTVELSLSKNL